MFISLRNLRGIPSFRKPKLSTKALPNQTQYILTCNELKLPGFVRCMQGDFTPLVISGRLDENALTAWNNIYMEFIELGADPKTRYLYGLRRDIALLNDEVLNVEICLYYLQISVKFAPELLGVLAKYGYKLKPMFTDSDIEVIYNRINSKKNILEQKIKELGTGATGGEKINEDYFINQVILLSETFCYKISYQDTTVKEYVFLVNRANKINDGNKRPNK